LISRMKSLAAFHCRNPKKTPVSISASFRIESGQHHILSKKLLCLVTEDSK
jgi:hypothetical protein